MTLQRLNPSLLLQYNLVEPPGSQPGGSTVSCQSCNTLMSDRMASIEPQDAGVVSRGSMLTIYTVLHSALDLFALGRWHMISETPKSCVF